MTPERLVLVLVLMGGIAVLVGLAAMMLVLEARRQDLEARVGGTISEQAPVRGVYVGVLGFVQRLGERARRGLRLYSDKDIAHLQGVIASAGHNPRQVLPLLIGIKVMLMVFLPIVAALAVTFVETPFRIKLISIGGAFILGMVIPDWVLGAVRRAHAENLDRATPDALDLLVVCSEAGMGLESALDRVSQEMVRSNRAMAIALSGLLDDLNVLPDRRQAFENFARRSGVEGLQRLAMMLAQALQFGTPLGQALRAVASELRRTRANRLEERAVKLPAKLILPLILFIMPSLYIVLLGPSFMRLFDVLGSFSQTLAHH